IIITKPSGVVPMKKFIAITILSASISSLCLAQKSNAVNKLYYHYDRQRSGWNPNETRLTPETVSGSRFGQLWQTPQFDVVEGEEPRLFASPLYVDKLTLNSGPYKGKTFSVVFATTDVGYIYAVNASAAGNVAPGTVLWKRRLTEAMPGGFGYISTPAIDLERQRIYVVGNTGPRTADRVYAMDLRSGEMIKN